MEASVSLLETVIDFEKHRIDNGVPIMRSESMTESIHGHEVMRRVIESGETYTPEHASNRHQRLVWGYGAISCMLNREHDGG